MDPGWRQTQYDEWWADGFGVVLDVQGILWYAYPFDESRRLGPFRSRRAAQRALESSIIVSRSSAG